MKPIIRKLKKIGGILSDGKIRRNLNSFLIKHHPSLLKEIVSETYFLPKDSPTRERVYCVQHNITTPPVCLKCKQISVSFTTLGKYSTFCSTKCSSSFQSTKNKAIQTNVKRYGVKHPNQLDINKKRIRQTNLKKYGAEYPQQNKNIQEKTKQTNLKKYGAEYPHQNKNIQEKTKRTILNRYGTSNLFSIPEIRDKIKHTIYEKYGVEHPQQNKSIQDKTKRTNLDRYGHQCSIGLRQQEFNKTRQKTWLDRYNRKFASQRHITDDSLARLNDSDWMEFHYIDLRMTTSMIGHLLNVNAQTISNYLTYHQIPRKQQTWYSQKCILWLEYISRTENLYIQHAENDGEFKIPGTIWHADGFCRETNTIYEFYGDKWHGNINLFDLNEYCHPFKPNTTAKELHQKTMTRQNTILHLGYQVNVIWELEFDQLFNETPQSFIKIIVDKFL